MLADHEELQESERKEESLLSTISAVKGARLLVDKWSVSKRVVISFGIAYSPGHLGDIELLNLFWSYYNDIKAENEDIDMRAKLQTMLVQAVSKGHTSFIRALLDLGREGGMDLDTSPFLLRAAETTGTLFTIKFLLEHCNSKMTREIFDAILKHGDLETSEWAMSNYRIELASTSLKGCSRSERQGM